MSAEKQKVPIFSRPWIVGLCITLFLLFFYWSFSFVESPREKLRIQECRSHLRKIALALYNYANVQKQFPPACFKDEKGTPLYSWRVAIAPSLESSSFAEKFHFNEAWDSPHNKKQLIDIPTFSCPSCKEQNLETPNYVLVIGPGTIWEDGKTYSLDDISHPEKVLVLIEVPDLGIHWAEPGDLAHDSIDARLLNKQGHFKTNHCNFIHAAFADGHVEKIPKEKILVALKNRSRVNQDSRKKE